MNTTLRHAFASAALLLATAVFAPLASAQDAQPADSAAQAAPAAPADQAAPAQAAPPAEEVAPAAAPAAAEPALAEAGRIGAPPAGKGQVVFFRQSKMAGMALSFSVHEGDKGVGKLGNGSYFVDVVDPGTHTFTIQSEATDSLTLEVEAGETYYVKQSIGMGIMVGRPHITPSDKAEFEKSKVKLSTKKATDLKPKA